jgi:hypothetical protein
MTQELADQRRRELLRRAERARWAKMTRSASSLATMKR